MEGLRGAWAPKHRLPQPRCQQLLRLVLPGFSNLTCLATLYLDRNAFSGQIPNLGHPALLRFDVSFNNLTGPLPADLCPRFAPAFAGNSLCCRQHAPCSRLMDGISPSPVGAAAATGGEARRKKRLSSCAIAGITVGSVLEVLLALALLMLLCRRNLSTKAAVAKAPENDEEDGLAVQKGLPESRLGRQWQQQRGRRRKGEGR